jgi:signal transduction histidine kinase
MSDQRMPGISGVQFLSNVKGAHPDAIRLLFTGYADIRAVIDAINQGSVYRYITKPWDPDELETIIDEASERYDLIVEKKHLIWMLQDRNNELEAANAELKRSNELKKAFIQVASHELRTPLTILLGTVHLARMAEKDGSQLLDRVEQAGERLARLVDQILTMLVAGNFEAKLNRKETDMSALLNHAAEDVRPFVALRKQELSVDLASDLGMAEVEADRIRDMLNHLLLNAVKFTPDGGAIALAAKSLGDEIEITVKDNGAGIDPASMPQLFKPFFTGFDVRHHSSGQFEHGRKGIGLGLSVVKAFVDMHGGKISAKSDVGQGTTFTIVLPRHPAQVKPEAAS